MLSIIVVLCFSFLLVACSGNENSESNSKSNGKGSKDNPYTTDEVITITQHFWEGNHIRKDRKSLGIGKFELSNFRFEEGTLDSTDVDVLVFDMKCIEMPLEDGWCPMDDGSLQVKECFDTNMQSLPIMEITDLYSGVDNMERIYFEDTQYTVAYALYSSSNSKERICDAEDAHLLRIQYNDENDELQYMYIQLD